jgi:hypothetical protein
MSSSLYTPLLLVAVVYTGLSIAAGIATRRGDTARGERLLDLGFATALIAAAYTVILLILAAVDAPGRFTDAITIMLVIGAFFVLLLLALFAVAQLFGRIRGRTGS